MSVEAFLDTNVLIYAVSSSPVEAEKNEKALDLISHADFGLSAQVLQEFYVNVTTKIAIPLAPDEAVALLEQFKSFPMVWTDYALIISAVETALRYGTSYWDGAIVAARRREMSRGHAEVTLGYVPMEEDIFDDKLKNYEIAMIKNISRNDSSLHGYYI